MKRIRWTVNAQRDLRALALFYGQVAPDLPEQLVADIERAVLNLLDQSHIGPTVAESTLRRWRAGGAPFLLFYRMSPGGVRILKVGDARSDWKPV